MNFAKFIRTPFLQNKTERLLLKKQLLTSVSQKSFSQYVWKISKNPVDLQWRSILKCNFCIVSGFRVVQILQGIFLGIFKVANYHTTAESLPQYPSTMRNLFSWVHSLHEKCPQSEFFWSHIRTEYGEMLRFGPNAGKYEPEKFRIRTLSTQCFFSQKQQKRRFCKWKLLLYDLVYLLFHFKADVIYIYNTKYFAMHYNESVFSFISRSIFFPCHTF